MKSRGDRALRRPLCHSAEITYVSADARGPTQRPVLDGTSRFTGNPKRAVVR
jgi:hypothetical protein